MSAAAIAAQLVDVRNVGHNKCIRLTLHVPAEQAPLVMNAFGWPTLVDPVPVALARLDPTKIESEVVQSETTKPGQLDTSPASGPDIPARAVNRLAQRAGILCNDSLFHRYLERRLSDGVKGPTVNTEFAAGYVREFCKVESRADIKPNTEAATRLDLLESAFICWRDQPELADAS